ncbi:MAG: hypothetical protein LBP21_04950 [Synergistaceae bacterium]|jgi:FSR family fosmidomycin resistance protein-like MFS transporter|nr:hypothetical protein [Synergistaceae bacterium]
MRNRVLPQLLVYSVAHALVDAVCASILTSLTFFGGLNSERALLLYLLYNFLAFAMQAPLGLCLDEIRCPRAAAQIGLGMQTAALAAFPFSPEFGVLLAGLGNALFHLGGGVIALNLTPGRATEPGIFIAPGVVGLFLGLRQGMAAPLSLSVRIMAGTAALALATLTAFLPIPESYLCSLSLEAVKRKQNKSPLQRDFLCAVGLIFFSIAVRSFAGLSVAFPWKNDSFLSIKFLPAFLLAAAAGGGKALGGFLSDRLGFLRVSTGALLLSIPFTHLGYVQGSYAPVIFGLAGCLCFQMTMAVTLLAYVRAYPRREAWAFGLACLALFVGALPLLLPLPRVVRLSTALNGPAARSALTFASILCLWRGLKILRIEKISEQKIRP